MEEYTLGSIASPARQESNGKSALSSIHEPPSDKANGDDTDRFGAQAGTGSSEITAHANMSGMPGVRLKYLSAC